MLQMILIIILTLSVVTLMMMTIWLCCKVSNMINCQISELDLNTERKSEEYGSEDKDRE